ncbi:hypothetical protein V6N11_034741 [Hibiscus sabdariffa]|uniref:Uncharacterized protein n=2 Tax=Hibiscus sabdariffa TaxID=183260 RepID=A0ABR2NRU3_9ROSI
MEAKESVRAVQSSTSNVRRRIGVSVFVDNVSKRIHRLALWEAFQVYGTVVDVYIALRNQKRKYKTSTFAFVRFKSEFEARRAVERGSGKESDDENVEGLPGDAIVITPLVPNNMKSAGSNETLIRVVKMWPPQPAGAVEVIKDMYNPEVVQEGLSSDGFNIIVCPWFGNLVILRCQDLSEKVRCWSMSLGSQWGEVLKVDEETAGLKRFDVAKILIRVQKVSNISDCVSIAVDGVLSLIKLSTEEFEDDRIFIDGEMSGGQGGASRDDASVHALSSNNGLLFPPVFKDQYISNEEQERGVDIGAQSPTKSRLQHMENSEAKWASDGLVNVPILSARNSITYPIDKELGPSQVNPGRPGLTVSDSITISNSSRLQDVFVEVDEGQRIVQPEGKS